MARKLNLRSCNHLTMVKYELYTTLAAFASLKLSENSITRYGLDPISFVSLLGYIHQHTFF